MTNEEQIEKHNEFAKQQFVRFIISKIDNVALTKTQRQDIEEIITVSIMDEMKIQNAPMEQTKDKPKKEDK